MKQFSYVTELYKRLMQELRRRLLQKVFDEYESTWQEKHPNIRTALEYDDFSLLTEERLFSAFSNDLANNINNTVKGHKNNVSEPTIRRILLNNPMPNLQTGTRSQIVRYLGYDTWEDFVNDVKELLEPKPAIIKQQIIIRPSIFDFIRQEKKNRFSDNFCGLSKI